MTEFGFGGAPVPSIMVAPVITIIVSVFEVFNDGNALSILE
jgi:hypothetical protein